MNQIFKPGDKFKLKEFVGYEDLEKIGFSSFGHIDWILDQEFFTVVDIGYPTHPSKIYWNSLRGLFGWGRARYNVKRS